MRRFELRRVAFAILGIFLSAAAVSIVRTTATVSNDFEVFWAAAEATWRGVSPYSVEVARGMVFKYPPWVLPIFMPFGLMPYEAAKWGWGLVEVLSLGAAVVWLVRRGCDLLTVLTVTTAFWGIWIVHALDGQITLVLLAISLWAVEGYRPSVDLGLRAQALIWTLSAKIFTVFSLLGVARSLRRWLTVGNILLATALFAGLSLPALVATPGANPVTLFQDWMRTAGSGGEELVGEKIRGRDNQGFPVVVLRALEVRADRKSMDILAFLLVALILGGTWSVLSAGLGFAERWVGWIGLGAAVHPLAWFHSFVLAFPLMAMALDRAIRRRHVLAIVLSVTGILCTAVLTSKVLGHIGFSLELASIKSWGVILSLIALKLSAQRRIGRS